MPGEKKGGPKYRHGKKRMYKYIYIIFLFFVYVIYIHISEKGNVVPHDNILQKLSKRKQSGVSTA